MKISDSGVAGVYLLEFSRFLDNRGRFDKIFELPNLVEKFKNFSLSEINVSSTISRGTLRGMHFQGEPHKESKIIFCLKGKIFDTVININPDSKNYLDKYSIELSEDNPVAIYVDSNFAHGYQTLSDDVFMIYMHSSSYFPGSQFGINPLDPKLKIEWPLEIMVISEKDRNAPKLDEFVNKDRESAR